MGRTREFDKEAVTERAMLEFWRRGYNATSLEHLLDAMKLSKSSLYETFGGKRDLLIAALGRYTETAMVGVLDPLLRPDAARDAIEETFARVVNHALGPRGQRGCLVNNTMAEVAPHDAKVLAAVRRARSFLELGLQMAVTRGQAQGTITVTRTPQALARFLANNLMGINSLAKAKPEPEVLQDIVLIALSALD
jgi:TetR/AcrR family transcriptional repressor of nem operon